MANDTTVGQADADSPQIDQYMPLNERLPSCDEPGSIDGGIASSAVDPQFALPTIEQACSMSREDRLDLMLRYNEMKLPIVIGEVISTPGKSGAKVFWLEKLHTLSGRPLLSPLEGAPRNRRVLLGYQDDLTVGDVVGCRVRMRHLDHPEVVRKKRPFAMEPQGRPFKLRGIPSHSVIHDSHGKFHVEESVFQLLKGELRLPLSQERHKYIDETDMLRRELKADLAREQEDMESLLETLTDAVQTSTEQLEEILARKQSKEAKLLAATRELSDRLVQADDLTHRIKDLEQKKRTVMQEYERLMDYARTQAELLKSLDLISEEQSSNLVGHVPLQSQSAGFLSWRDDLGMDYHKLVSTIHAFLLSRGVIYPRWLVANFLTLLRTNDLVILSGLSGAGKTQIVRSFAEALGGVVHVMSVKPNWTGAEDLLGFFNPLQRSYVRTSFLDALLSASRDPDHLHLVCLDEMNLARAEYYFADFLSALEEREILARIPLYSESEASHVQAEVRMLLAALRGSGVWQSTPAVTGSSSALESLMQHPESMAQIRCMFGESAAESFPAFHGRVRRALTTVLDIPSTLQVPSNVRFIGAINVDQTTYALSPKILDRAHVLRFENPLKYAVAEIRADVEQHMPEVARVAPVHVPPVEFMPQRSPYPEYDADHPAAQWLEYLYRDYLAPLGLDVAFRTIRQAQMYWDLLRDVVDGDAAKHEAVAKNLIVLQKVLPKFTIDGKAKATFRKEATPREKWEIVREMEQDLRATAEAAEMHPNMQEELHRVRMAAETNDKIFNYWA